jgi:hypothetical protein
LWDFELERIHDIYEKESGSLYESPKESNGRKATVQTVVLPLLSFGDSYRDPDSFSYISWMRSSSNILVAAYSDGDTVVYETSSGGVRGALRGVNAHALA